MNDKNMLLGYGETLTNPVKLNRGGGEKNKPYSYSENKPVISAQLEELIEEINTLPLLAMPEGKAVAKFVLHPAFLAKSYFPVNLFERFSLESIGSKAVKVKPRKDIKKRGRKEEYTTACIYVSGKKESFQSFLDSVNQDTLTKGQQNDFVTLENISILEVSDKVKTINSNEVMSIEVALHTPDTSSSIVDSFEFFASQNGAVIDKARSIKVKGLTFMPIKASKDVALKVAEFSFLRTLRELPELRLSEPVISRSVIQTSNLSLPSEGAVNPHIKVAIFDGGLGIDDFNHWVTEYTFNGNASTNAKLLSHGQDVTSTVLFGVLGSETEKLSVPYCNIDHYRVLDSNVNNSDVDLFDVLIRIKSVLEQKKYDYINLSLGPRLPVDDDDVHVWTSTLEEILASGETLCTVAVGNDGQLPAKLNRIQPPADLVNGLSVGAATSLSDSWERCSYSCIGPGRSPGFVKPDGVAFGGHSDEPFQVYSPMVNGLARTAGTSFSAPLVLRQAIALSASLNYNITPLTAKALLIHHAESNNINRAEVGWGRFPHDLSEVIFCDDDEVKVIYQGTLKPSQHMRAPIPFPDVPMRGCVNLRATFCFSSPVDAEHPLNYTRSGLEVTMRKGVSDSSGLTFPLFNLKNVYADENEQRVDAHKWETTLRSEHKFKPNELTNPCFDIIYYGRDCGMPIDVDELEELPYVLVVTLSAEEMPDLYNLIRQKYQTLQPIQVQQQIMLRT
ncbi:S8 family peptidase [Salmonella enterica subsp. enterica serovar Muenchen]|uniref:S8 family peptidase n=1 Tax=Salmonella enterica TaxID=28901 RepID=UPI00127C5E56|nr:S8 family peptidase [Salmonella enterica]EAY0362324.1 S8 family peptidase [Salmonella enterica]EAZ5765482.1 S8 family peptidase [Salmonella enterica]EBA8952101.1 S8 family peptidase [Salmonella enterica]EBD7187020.1 S8 family peptidase [Salmonella enterica]EBI2619253.1 peptidase S8 [Salmonella enterica]